MYNISSKDLLLRNDRRLPCKYFVLYGREKDKTRYRGDTHLLPFDHVLSSDKVQYMRMHTWKIVYVF